MSIGESSDPRYNTTAGMIEYMELHDLHLVIPKADELFIDIDSKENSDLFSKNYRLLSGCMKDLTFMSFSSAPSRRKKEGVHITIRLSRNISAIERIALQAVLGSDMYRELFSVAQYFNNEPIPTVFLEAKPKKLDITNIIDEEVIDESNGVSESKQGTCEGVGSGTPEQQVPTDEGMSS